MKSKVFIAILAAAALFGPTAATATPAPIPVHRTTTPFTLPIEAGNRVAAAVQEREYEARESAATDLEAFHGGASDEVIIGSVLLGVLLIVLLL